jgi:DNA-binding transcriptional MocR family regulator
VALDEHDVLDPNALEAVLQSERPKAFYCMPTLPNPTATTMSLERREQVVEIIRRYGVAVIEDDDYGDLPEQLIPPLAALAPELTYHIAGLSKCLSPALMAAYVVTPDAWSAARLASVMRINAGTVSPMSAALASQWIEDGTANQVVKAIRAEASERRAVAARMLPALQPTMPSDGFHVWLRLPEPWTSGEFVGGLRQAGIGIVGREAFALTPSPEAVRIALGISPTCEQLRHGLGMVADLLTQPPTMLSTVF